MLLLRVTGRVSRTCNRVEKLRILLKLASLVLDSTLVHITGKHALNPNSLNHAIFYTMHVRYMYPHWDADSLPALVWHKALAR